MKNYFPQKDKQYLQTNRSNILGNLWSSLNLDLESNLGAMRLGTRLKLNTSTADDADLGCPVAFKRFSTKIWAICGTRIFTNGGEPQMTFTEDASTGAVTDYSSDYSDLEIFNGLLWSSTTDELLSCNGGTWTSRDTLTASTIHVMTYFKKFNRLYYSDDIYTIRSIDTSNVVASSGDYFINLLGNSTLVITCLKTTSDYIWIGCKGNTIAGGLQGYVLKWDGISAQVTDSYKIDGAQGVNSMVIRNNVPYIMDSRGILLKYTGSSFEEVGRLPATENLINFVNDKNDRFIHPNGLITTKNVTILALVNNEYENNAGSIAENLPSGVWEWSEDKGFIHKHPFTYNSVANSTITDYGQNRISRVGAIADMNISSTTSGYNGTMMMGATIFTNATDSVSAIFINDSNNTVQKKSYFVTTWFESNEVADAWDALSASFKTLATSGDNIVFKYRTTEISPVEATITWINTTSFTVLNSACDVSNYWTSGTGGEVEIIQGTGSASCAHITNAVNNAGTWTVTLDETITGVTTGTAKARFQKWIKLFPKDTLTTISTYLQTEIGTDSTPRIQIKGCLTYTGDGEFYKAIINSNEDIKS